MLEVIKIYVVFSLLQEEREFNYVCMEWWIVFTVPRQLLFQPIVPLFMFQNCIVRVCLNTENYIFRPIKYKDANSYLFLN